MFCFRRSGEDSDGEYFRDSSSDGSSDSEQERGGLNYSREQPSYLQSSNSPLTVDQMAFQEGFSSDEGETGSSQGCLLFEYLERDPPYSREPLANKVPCVSYHKYFFIISCQDLCFGKQFIFHRYLILLSNSLN